MTKIRYKNLYDALITHKKYCKLIEGYGRRKVSFEDANLELLQTIHAGFLLTQIMDEYFIKVDCDITSKLIPEKVKELVCGIAKNNGSGYTLGDLMYKDEYTVLEKVRNKLAHGDFIIIKGEIVFEEHGVEGRINADKFINLVYELETKAKKITLEEPCVKVLNKVFESKNVKSIDSEERLDMVCKNLYRVELEEVPIPPKKRDPEYIKFIEEKYDKLIDKMENLTLEELEIYLETLKARFLKKDIELKFSIKNMKELEHYNCIKSKYMSDIDNNKILPLERQINRINNLSYVLGHGRYQKFDIAKGLELNINFMQVLKKHPEYTFEQMIYSCKDIGMVGYYHYDSAILASYLAGFNAIYEYGLENGLTEIGQNNLISVLEGKTLDFSRLDLEELDVPNLKIEHEFKNYEKDIKDYEREQLDGIKIKIKSIEKILDSLNNSKKNVADRIAKFDQELKNAKLLKREIEEKVKRLRDLEKSFDFEKYKRNFNIITYIRNAIAHGNIYVDSYATNIMESDIIIVNEYEGKIVYEKKIKAKDFIKIFEANNVNYIQSFYLNNIENKLFVDANTEVLEKDAHLIKK